MTQLCVVVSSAVLLTARSALADEPPQLPPPPPPYGEPPPAPRSAPAPYEGEPLAKPAPLGHHGFQMAIRTGLAFPSGMAYSRTASVPSLPAAAASLGDVAGVQVPIILDIGGKPDRHIFVGGYLGFGLGSTAGAFGTACDSCASTTRMLGAEVYYSILPDDWVNPWIGYGFGFSWFSAGDRPEVDLHGVDFARLTLGVDFRLSRTIGVGPYVDYDVGEYTYANGEIHGRTIHEWLVVGPRFVLLP